MPLVDVAAEKHRMAMTSAWQLRHAVGRCSNQAAGRNPCTGWAGPSLRHLAPLFIIAVASLTCGVCAAQPAADSAALTIADQTDLASLIDLCVDRLNLNIEYDANAMRGQSVSLRLAAPLSADELWAMVNQLLAQRGFAVIRLPGTGVLSIVPVAQASERAGVELPDPAPSDLRAGYDNTLVRARHRPTKELLEIIKPLLSKSGGAAAALGDEGLMLVSDTRDRLDLVRAMLDAVDVPGPVVTIERVPLEHANAPTLVAALTATVDARNSLGTETLRGKLRPLPEEAAVVLVAPVNEVATWTALIKQFDLRQPLITRSYAPRYFAIEEVAKLVEQTARDASPRGAGDRWQLISDQLTGSVIVTATESEHDRIDELIDRLDSIPPAARQPIRTFQIKNRSVNEVLEVLNQLMQQGALESGEVQSGAAERAAGPVVNASQQTQRDVLPPAGSLGQPSQPVVPSPVLPADAVSGQPSRRDSASQPQRLGRAAASRDSTAGPGTVRPLLSLTADEATNTLIAVGEPRLLTQLDGLLRVLDVRQPQVMLEAMVISLNDADTLDLGVELQKIEISGSTIMSLSSIFGLGIPAATSAVLPNPTGSGFTGLALNPGDFSVLIRALQTLNDGRSLSMPKVLVNNNQDASLDAVLQQPFTSTNASTTVATTSFGGTQDAGTTITVKPQIATGDELVLTYSVALSSFVGESSDPNIPPPRQQNTVSSVVRIPDGYTIVVGGLELTTDSEAVSQIPLLGSIPVIGELFKSRSNSDSTTRFYVFIRAAILRHEDFEDLKYLSDRDAKLAEVDDGWPEVRPRLIR